MAQVVKLKRTSVQGRIPTISNLELGELAINTHDGRIFFQKDDGTLSIQEILTTNSDNSGSFNLTGAISASSLSIGGNTIIGGSISFGDASIATQSGTLGLTATSGISLLTSGGGDGVVISANGNTTIYGALALQDIPVVGTATSALVTNGGVVSQRTLGSNAFTSASYLKVDGDGVISGSSQLTSSFDTRYLNVSGEGTISGSFSGSFNGDGSGLTNLQVSSSIVEATTVTSSFDNQTSVVVNHNFDSRNVIVSVYDTEYEQIIPQSVILTDNDNVTISFPSVESGIVVVAKGGHIVSSDSLTTYRVDVSGASSYAVSHSLDEEYPFVQTWNTDTNKQEQPLDVESTSPSSLTVTFSGNFTGKIIVKR